MVTVGELIEALSKLPMDTEVRDIGPGSDAPLDRGRWCQFYVLRKNGKLVLYIVDHNATYSDLESDWEPLLKDD